MRELRKETETWKNSIVFSMLSFIIRNERTPKGDGNLISNLVFYIGSFYFNIRNERTPKGDGNPLLFFTSTTPINKK